MEGTTTRENAVSRTPYVTTVARGDTSSMSAATETANSTRVTHNLCRLSRSRRPRSQRHTRWMEEQNHLREAPLVPHLTPVHKVRPPNRSPVDFNIIAVGTDKKVDPYLAAVEINGATLLMEIDTGSALTLISQETFRRLWPQGESPKLDSTPIRLRTYSGEGQVRVR